MKKNATTSKRLSNKVMALRDAMRLIGEHDLPDALDGFEAFLTNHPEGSFPKWDGTPLPHGVHHLFAHFGGRTCADAREVMRGFRQHMANRLEAMGADVGMVESMRRGGVR